MAIMKYSIGGTITSVRDEDSTEKHEESAPQVIGDQKSYIIVCCKCDIQHMILQATPEKTCFCGNIIKLNSLS